MKRTLIFGALTGAALALMVLNVAALETDDAWAECVAAADPGCATGGDDDGYVDWVITNPPFTKAEAFIERAFEVASTGVAMLVRANFLEGTGRYERIFSKRPPTIIAYFSERVSIVPGKVDPKANQPTAYVWLVWTAAPPQPVVWIPPCRAALTRPDDHIPPAERGR